MKYLGYIYKVCVIIGVILFLIVFVGIGMEKSVLVHFFWGEYPIQGDYYIEFSSNNGTYDATLKYYDEIYTKEKIDTANLKIFPNLVNTCMFQIDKDIVYDNDKLKEFLLLNGLAKIVDKNKATSEETEAQNYAKENMLGCWSQKKADFTENEGQLNNEFSVLKLINWLKTYYASIVYLIIRFVIAVLGITFIISCLIKFFRRNNVDIIFWGEIASGKTTVAYRLRKPEISKTELLQITSTKGTSINKAGRIAFGKKDIYPYLIDNPGQQYDKMFDKVNKGIFSNPHQILLITIALGQGNETLDRHIDNPYLEGEISKAVQIITIVTGSKKLKKSSRTIILFINKCDLLYKNEQELFNDENKEKVNSCLKKAFDYELLLELEERNLQNVHRVYGSALEGWGISNIRDIIEKI